MGKVRVHGAAQTEWGPGYEQYKGKLSVGQVLAMEHSNGVDPIIWAYSAPDGNFTAVDFGYDKQVGGGKIGHMALVANATISGEIHPDGAGGWKIDNNSGVGTQVVTGCQRRQVGRYCRRQQEGHLCIPASCRGREQREMGSGAAEDNR